MKASVLRYAAIGMASLSLAGFAAASTVTVTGSGPESHNKVNLSNKLHVSSTNTNVLGVTNFSGQGAASGSVKSHENTNAGSATSGDATNNNTAITEATVSNTGAASGLGALAGMSGSDTTVTLTGSGPHSNNKVDVDNSTKVKLTNTNIVQVDNVSLQSAKSGSVKASENTGAGNLTSGAASNTNTTTTTVGITN
ncbi:MAG: hypothetical protein JWN01_837 [Patescibacteria group bacterium]|nr:hypothetical protein [Patescibacteria group bacterium]